MILKFLVTCFLFASAIDGNQLNYKFSDEADGWLKLYKDPMTWNDAKIRCDAEGSVLMSPLAVQLRDGIKKHLLRVNETVSTIYTGTHAEYTDGDFFSVEGVLLKSLSVPLLRTENIEYTSSESCIAWDTTSDTLRKVDCESKFPYICYKKRKTAQLPTENTGVEGSQTQPNHGAQPEQHQPAQQPQLPHGAQPEQHQPAQQPQLPHGAQPDQRYQPAQQPQPTYGAQPDQRYQPAQQPQPTYGAQPDQRYQPAQQPQPTYGSQPDQQHQATYGAKPNQPYQPAQQPQPTYGAQPNQQYQPAQQPQPPSWAQPDQRYQPVQQPQPFSGAQPDQWHQPAQQPHQPQHNYPTQQLPTPGATLSYWFNRQTGWGLKMQQPDTWNAALNRCAAEGAVLASPLTTQLNDEIKAYVKRVNPSVSSIYTGVHASFSNGDFYSTEGVPLTNMPVSLGSSQNIVYNDTNSCVVMNTFNTLVTSVRCTERHPYVCLKRSTVIRGCGARFPGYIYDPRTESCYKFHNNGQTWTSAYNTCRAEGGYLAIINSQQEYVALKELIAMNPSSKLLNYSPDSAYIGRRDWQDGKSWVTVKGESLPKSGYIGWAETQPNNAKGNENCGTLNRNGINDDPCDLNLAFICEKESEILDSNPNFVSP